MSSAYVVIVLTAKMKAFGGSNFFWGFCDFECGLLEATQLVNYVINSNIRTLSLSTGDSEY